MKKIISAFLVFVIMLSLSLGVSASSEFTTADALAILRHAIGAETLSAQGLERYDFNNDGIITTANALLVLQVVVGINELPSKPAPPEPEPPEPTLPPLSLLPLDIEAEMKTHFARYATNEFHEALAQQNYQNYAHARFTVSDIDIEEYFGTYNGYMAVMISWGRTWQEWGGGGKVVYLFKDSSFILIKDAYEQRLISRADVINIHHYSGYFFPLPFERETPPPFVPLSVQAELKIRENYLVWSRVADTIDRVKMFGYYGTYNGWDAVAMRAWATPTAGIAGVGGEPVYFVASFYFDVITIYLHKDGTFICLREAFAQGLASENDVYQIHYHWEQEYERRLLGL